MQALTIRRHVRCFVIIFSKKLSVYHLPFECLFLDDAITIAPKPGMETSRLLIEESTRYSKKLKSNRVQT